MSAKDNFAQAMKELLNGGEGEPQNSDVEEKKASPSSFSSFSQPETRINKTGMPEKTEEKPATGSLFGGGMSTTAATENKVEEKQPVVPAPAPAPAPAVRPSSMFGGVATAEETPVVAVQPEAVPAVAPVTQSPATSATVNEDTITVISPGTVIVGDITVAGALRVNGSIKGNVQVSSKLELNGKIIGDIQAEDAVIEMSTIKGNITVKNTINMDGETTIVGDITAKTSEINGKVKGNLTVDERGHFQPSAILVGNLVAGTVIIEEGAMLKGDISITNAQMENITVEEPDFDIEL